MATTKKSTAAAASKTAKPQPAAKSPVKTVVKAASSAKAPVAVRTLPKKPVAPVKSAAEQRAAAAMEAAAAQSRAALQTQMKQWEQAVNSFSQRKFAPAQALFEQASKGPASHIADKARSYAQICARKTNGADVNLHTADDHFNYGVERLNARDMEKARHHLARALALEPAGEHILFTLALCCGLDGDGDGACEHLKRAIDLEPKNRILARQDPEFMALAQQIPLLRALLTAESADGF